MVLLAVGMPGSWATTTPTPPVPSDAARSGAPSGSSGSADLRTPQTSMEGIAVSTYGTVVVRPNQTWSEQQTVLAVHAVQRTPTGTVVYLSAGWTGDQEPPNIYDLSEQTAPGHRFIGGSRLLGTRLVLPGTSTVLSTLPDSTGNFNEAFTSERDAVPEEAGVMGVIYAVLPALPAGVDTVDVQLGFAGVVPDVPVGEGLLEPTVTGPVVPLGTGWPEIPADVLAAPDQPELSTFELSARTEAIDGSQRETGTADDVTIEISADVLFAVDSADLNASARRRVADLAADITARAVPGELTVVGHTDSDGSDSYNDDLSRRRAQAVADVLGPALGASFSPAVEGRGEDEPVADNNTPEGKQKNRRVAITFGVGATR